MKVCINESMIKESILRGNTTPGKIAKDCAFRFQCGSCKCTIIEQVIKEETKNNTNV